MTDGLDVGPSTRPALSMVCPELVGRDDETARLHERVDAAAAGRGAVVVLVGEAGAGKSRLAREVIGAGRARGAEVLFGRAVPGANTVPHRPLAEALLAAYRSSPPPAAPELAGFGGHLARLLPHWWPDAPVGGAEASPVLLHEAVVRLLSVSGRGRGVVLVLEDLHWADAETIGAVDYFADVLPGEPVLCVCTCRPDDTAAAELSQRLLRRDPGSVLPVPSLRGDDIDRMLAACLGGARVPRQLAEFVRAHSDGNPFLVEELLAGVVASGELRLVDGDWSTDGMLTPTVPASLGDSIHRRLAGLDPTARRVLGAAALLGRRFEWELVPGIAEVDGRAAVDGLRSAVDAQLIEVEGSGFRFRHALTREAVLADLLPPDRAQLARRAWPAVERAHPGLPGGFCELAAELAEAADAPEAAATHLIASAGRACRDGALSTAEAVARRARTLAPQGAAAAAAAEEMLVTILVAAGKTAEALAVGRGLAARFDVEQAPPERRTDLLLQLAHAALTAGDTHAADGYTAAARGVVGRLDDATTAAVLTARIDAVAGHVALEQGRWDEASALARAAVAAAEATGQPAVECEALQVLGRVSRQVDLDEGAAWFERASDVAVAHRLPGWHLRARQELTLIAWGRDDLAPLRETRELAAGYGALLTVAVMDLSLADIALCGFDRAGCLAAAEACARASRRYGLATDSVAHLWLAGAHALAGDDRAMNAAVEQALAPAPDDPRILGDLYGRVLATRSFVADDLGALRGQLDAMMPYVDAAPAGTSVFPGRLWWATLHTIDDDDHGAGPRAHFRAAAEGLGMDVFVADADVADAVALGRAGEPGAAAALMTSARERLRQLPRMLGMSHCQQLLVARAAARDGWGEPAAWLRESEAFFAAGGYHRLARRCRTMLGELGAPVPRRGRGTSEVPPALRGLGVTSREVDVLTLVAAGHSTKQIAERLYLSTKTIERHLSNLSDRTGRRGRAALAELAREHGLNR